MIRPTVADDFPTLIALTEATGFFKLLEIEALDEVFADFDAVNHELDHCCLTYEQEGNIAGFAYYAPAPMTDRTWHLWWIVVDQNLQGKGIGSKLLAHVENDLRQRDARVLFIETGSVEKYEPTRQFYRNHDYEEHAVLKDFYAEGDSMVVFRKAISDRQE